MDFNDKIIWLNFSGGLPRFGCLFFKYLQSCDLPPSSVFHEAVFCLSSYWNNYGSLIKAGLYFKETKSLLPEQDLVKLLSHFDRIQQTR